MRAPLRGVGNTKRTYMLMMFTIVMCSFYYTTQRQLESSDQYYTIHLGPTKVLKKKRNIDEVIV